MPSLNPKRVIRYTKADLESINRAHAVVEFMQEFETGYSNYVGGELATILKDLGNFIYARRKSLGAKNGTQEEV